MRCHARTKGYRRKAFSNAQTKKLARRAQAASRNKSTLRSKKYGWGDDFKRFSGNAKVEAAAYVYNRKDGKLLGQKFTSKAFADKIEKKLKTEMQNAANENMLK